MLSYLEKNRRLYSRTIWLSTKVAFVLLIWLANIGFLSQFYPYYTNEKKWQSDFLVKSLAFIDTAKYYACAQIGRENPKQLWDQSTLESWFKDHFPVSQLPNRELTNRLSWAPYTPQSIVLFMPLSFLPLHMVIIIMAISTLLSMIIFITILIKRYFSCSLSQITCWWTLVLAYAPLTTNFYFGQMDGLLTVLSAIFILNWQKKNCIWAALSLAATSAIKPQRAGIMLIMALADKKFGLLFCALCIYIILSAVSMGVLGWDIVLAYPTKLALIHQAIDKSILPNAMYASVGIAGLAPYIFDIKTADIISFTATAFCMLASYIIWRRAVQVGASAFPHAYASSVLLHFIFGPYQHIYSLILLSVVWAWTVPVVSLKETLLVKQPYLRCWCLLFLFSPLLSWLIFLYNPGFGTVSNRYLPILLVMLFISLANFRQSLKQAPFYKIAG